jgi:hypothetical protein
MDASVKQIESIDMNKTLFMGLTSGFQQNPKLLCDGDNI